MAEPFARTVGQVIRAGGCEDVQARAYLVHRSSISEVLTILKKPVTATVYFVWAFDFGNEINVWFLVWRKRSKQLPGRLVGP